MADKHELFARRLKLISLIPRAPKSASTKELHNAMLADERELSLRQLQKELFALLATDELGIAYYEGEKQSEPPVGGEKSYGDQVNNRPRNWYIKREAAVLELPHMDSSAALVFKLSDRYLRDLLPDVVFQNVEHYFNRAEKILSKAYASQRWLRSVAMVSKSLPLQRPIVKEDVVSKVYEALQKGKQLRVKSKTRQSPLEPKEYFINPLGIVYRDPSIYLVWTPVEGEAKIKEFVMHRLTEAEVLDDACKIPNGFSLDRFITENMGFSYFVDEKNMPYIDMEFLANDALKFKLSETPLDESQKILESDEEGWFRVTATVPYTHQLMAWIREQGYEIKILGPVVLRDEIVRQIRKMAENYDGL